MKRIVVCCDGTWNSPAQANTTNVYKISRAIPESGADGVEQLVYYDEGVGAGSLLERLPGAFGIGVWRNVQRAYRHVVDHYESGDEIYLIGFSRGAYTVRSTAGMIRKCGVLRRDNIAQLKQAYSFYRDRKVAPADDVARQFRAANSVLIGGDDPYVPPLRFVGVWDTVGALGVPPGLFSTPVQKLLQYLFNRGIAFHDVALSRSVERAYQALAIDERRGDYRPSIWEQHPEARLQVLEQRWFSGVHTDVGGGAADPRQPEHTLTWMIDKARAAGLSFDAAYLQANVHDSIDGRLNSSVGYIFKLRPFYRRPIGEGVPVAEATYLAGASNEDVDPAVIDRNLKDPKYLPPNLVAYYRAHPDVLPPADAARTIGQERSGAPLS
jgi:uncharacterized protein (DUF2235 family)